MQSEGPPYFTRFTPPLVVGLGVAFIGVALLLDRLGIVHAWTLLQYWSVMVILFGASLIATALHPVDVTASARTSHSGAAVLVFVLVIVGFASAARHQRPNGAVVPGSDYVTMHSVMGGTRHTNRSTEFKGASITSVMGGTHLDLRQATMASGAEAVIDVVAIMGGVELFVPREWTVDVQVAPVLGGVDDRRFNTGRRRRGPFLDRDDDGVDRGPGGAASGVVEGGPTATAPVGSSNSAKPDAGGRPPRLIVRGFVMMGGLDIKP